MSAVILRDQIIHYEVLGRGRPLFFLHGWVGSWRYWVPAMQSASQGFRTYALDLWGFGDTAKNPNYYSIKQQIDLLVEFLGKMGIDKIALVGHGLGAIIALLYTARYPHLVDRVMVINLPSRPNAVYPRLRAASPMELAEWLLVRTSFTEPIWAEVPKTDPKAILLSITDLDQLDLRNLTNRTNTPCLLVHGQNDPAFEPMLPEEITALPDHVHYIAFDGSAHFPMLDETSKFNRLLADFLGLDSGESPRQLQLKEEWKRRVR